MALSLHFMWLFEKSSIINSPDNTSSLNNFSKELVESIKSSLSPIYLPLNLPTNIVFLSTSMVGLK